MQRAALLIVFTPLLLVTAYLFVWMIYGLISGELSATSCFDSLDPCSASPWEEPLTYLALSLVSGQLVLSASVIWVSRRTRTPA